MIKTPITVLQEMMIKIGLVPEYECVSQSGPQHQAMFEYRCTVNGSAASGLARSKKEAKQEAARRILQVLYARGMDVPPPYATPPDSQPRPPSPPSPTNNPALEPGPSAAGGGASTLPLDTRSYVALLKELCEEYRLGEAEYELVGDTGPAHQRHFTIRARLGLHSRQCTSTTKKAARQQAAEQLYKYLRDNLSRLTGDFVEEEALARALEKSLAKKKEAAGGGIDAAIERLTELREAGGRRPDLGQRISEYHLGLMIHIDEAKRRSGREALSAAGACSEPERALQQACGALGLRVERGVRCGAGVAVLSLCPSSPPLSFAGADAAGAARAALRYLRRGLRARDDARLA